MTGVERRMCYPVSYPETLVVRTLIGFSLAADPRRSRTFSQSNDRAHTIEEGKGEKRSPRERDRPSAAEVQRRRLADRLLHTGTTDSRRAWQPTDSDSGERMRCRGDVALTPPPPSPPPPPPRRTTAANIIVIAIATPATRHYRCVAVPRTMSVDTFNPRPRRHRLLRPPNTCRLDKTSGRKLDMLCPRYFGKCRF